MTTGLRLDEDALCRVLPFHLVVSEEGEILQLGRAWERRFPDVRVGGFFDDHFQIHRPRLAAFDAKLLAGEEERMLLLRSLPSGLELRAQVVPADGAVFLVASPRLRAIDEVKEAGLHLEDFALHEAATEHLFTMQSQSLALREARRFADLLADQRQELRRLNERLRHEMAEVQRARDERIALERRIQEAERLESLGVLAGGVAHDFNNLLVPIVANAEMLQADATDAESRRSAEEILQASQIATELCQQMLSYAGRTPVQLESFGLDELVTNLEDLLRATARGSALEFDLQGSPRGFRADSTQIRQVLLNLTLNAAEACGAAGGCVTIRTGEHRPDDAEESDGSLWIGDLDPELDYAFIEVEDDGVGMDADTLERAFDPFFSTKLLGRGLGMAVVFGIVRRHDGAAKVSSRPGRGTVIRVLFPARDTSTPRLEEVAPCLPADGPRGRILLVDDDPRVRRVAQRMLTRGGYEASSAAHGEEALDRCEKEGHDLSCILLDLSMPGIGGDEVYRRLRRSHPQLPIVLMSGYTAERIGELLQGDEHAHFLHKPFSSDALFNAVTKATIGAPCTDS